MAIDKAHLAELQAMHDKNVAIFKAKQDRLIEFRDQNPVHPLAAIEKSEGKLK